MSSQSVLPPTLTANVNSGSSSCSSRPMRGGLTQAFAVRFLLSALTILASSLALAGQRPPVLRGEWVASIGTGQRLRGRWIGQALAGRPGTMQGSWTLTDDVGKTILSGTWSARKTGPRWQGSWSAQDQFGRTLSGAWKADGPNIRGKNLQDLFEQTLKEQISGLWRSRRQQGRWWLGGSSTPVSYNWPT